MIFDHNESCLEAVLFACGSPIERDRLCSLLGLVPDELEPVIESLRRKLDELGGGIELITLDGSVQLCTRAVHAAAVKSALEQRKAPPLSKAALEVLAIIAYNGPVTRSFVEQVRGVDSSYIIAGLADKGLIRELGTLDAPGRPTLFGTTENFLRCFGLESLGDLPQNSLEESGAEEQLKIEQ